MRLLRVQLANFKIFKMANIEFNRPLTILFGPNASGKTIILEAILLATGQRQPLLRDRYLHHGLKTGKAEISLQIILSSKEWTTILDEYSQFHGLASDQVNLLAMKLQEIPVELQWSRIHINNQEIETIRNSRFIGSGINNFDSQQKAAAKRSVESIPSVIPTSFFKMLSFLDDYGSRELYLPKDVFPSDAKLRKTRETTEEFSTLASKTDSGTSKELALLFKPSKYASMAQNALAFFTTLTKVPLQDFLLLFDSPFGRMDTDGINDVYHSLRLISNSTQVVATSPSLRLLKQVKEPTEIIHLQKVGEEVSISQLGKTQEIEELIVTTERIREVARQSWIRADERRGLMASKPSAEKTTHISRRPSPEMEVDRAFIKELIQYLTDANAIATSLELPMFFYVPPTLGVKLLDPVLKRKDFTGVIRALSGIFEVDARERSSWQRIVGENKGDLVKCVSKWLDQNGVQDFDRIIKIWGNIRTLRHDFSHTRRNTEATRIMMRLRIIGPNPEFHSAWITILDELMASLRNLLTFLLEYKEHY